MLPSHRDGRGGTVGGRRRGDGRHPPRPRQRRRRRKKRPQHTRVGSGGDREEAIARARLIDSLPAASKQDYRPRSECL